jgi:tRNA-splicing ligase RtcB
MTNYIEYDSGKNKVKAWVNGVFIDSGTIDQLKQTALLDIIHHHVSAMPDCHVGRGATVGSVIATKKAIIPAAVGVDLGCGMMSVKTSLTAEDLPDSMKQIRMMIESIVPLGFDTWAKDPYNGSKVDKYYRKAKNMFAPLNKELEFILDKHPKIKQKNTTPYAQMGSLGNGNHFIEVCLDMDQNVWIMLHSGSRGIGNRIGTYFIEKAKKEMERQNKRLPNKDLAYLPEGSEYFSDYIDAVGWAQRYARRNRDTMMDNIVTALKRSNYVPMFSIQEKAINCHHNYISTEYHFGEEVFVTRKGAINAEEGRLGIIPGSMGAKSFIVRGKGNPDSFNSCSHGAGRIMSRSKAKEKFTLDDHIKATEGVECRKDEKVIDETPKAYKDIEKVMAAQSDLVEVVATLKQIVCVKG